MIKAGIIGATGYGGRETIRILLKHPETEIKVLAADPSFTGQRIDDVFPELRGRIEMVCQDVDLDKFGKECDVVFLATPDGLAMKFAPGMLAGGAKVIDYAADFRLQDVEVYEKYYGIKHTEQELLKKAVYGLPEFNASEIATASVIGNPGCFPTAVILGAAPLLKESLIQDNAITAMCLTVIWE